MAQLQIPKTKTTGSPIKSGTSVEDDRRESLKQADPAHFHEVTFVVEHLRVGLAKIVGVQDLGAEPVHRDRAVEQRGLQDAGLVLAGGVVGREHPPHVPLICRL